MKKRKGTPVIWFTLGIAICVMIFSGYKLWETQQIYRQGDENYLDIVTLVRGPWPSQMPDEVILPQNQNSQVENEDIHQREPQVDMPFVYIDFDALKAINPDAAAWLYSPDTVIDYPVMRADDYSWYLSHLPNGTENANGTLFLDYNSPADFSGALSIIYGHNMKSGKMFGSLGKYKNQAYFDEHQYMYLNTAENGNYRIDLLYGCVIGANQWRERAFMFDSNLPSLLAYAQRNTTFVSDVEYTDADRFVVLATCSYEFDTARYIVIGKLMPEFADDAVDY